MNSKEIPRPPNLSWLMLFFVFVRNLAASAAVSAASRTNRLQADHVQLPKHLAPPVSRQHWFSLSILFGPLLGPAAFARVLREEWKSGGWR